MGAGCPPDRPRLNLLERLRLRVAGPEAVLALSVLGIASGLLTGAVIIAFRQFIEFVQVTGLLEQSSENYEALPPAWRVLLPVGGGLAIGLAFQMLPRQTIQVGVLHVMERLAYHQGRLPLRNAVVQFFAGATAIVSGHSVGREGPGIHLGAAASSVLGERLNLPNNSIRTLVACGTAASIGASFNTPMAGVILAMEVIMMEYTIAGFTPVILSAVCATALTHLVYGDAPAFEVPALRLASLLELPYIVFLGVCVGTLAGTFTRATRRIDRATQHVAIWLRLTTAGAITGLIALAVPEVMGIGYDTVEVALLGGAGLLALTAITFAKLGATIACIGLGTPAGLIGPTLVMGATAGAALGILGTALAPEHSAGPGLYAMLGMGAMMGATLQAPLAALVAVLELTANPGIIVPGMLAIVSATLTAKGAFGQDSVFITIMRTRGLDYRYNPVTMARSRTGVAAVMSRRFAVVDRSGLAECAAGLLESAPRWVVVFDGEELCGLATCAELTDWLQSSAGDPGVGHPDTRDVCRGATVVPARATLQETLELMDRNQTDAACVVRGATATPHNIYGVVTREEIQSRFA